MSALRYSLWDFSLTHYAKPQMADWCLQLQDTHGVNINLMLWCFWLESENRLLTHQGLQAAFAAINPWHKEYVEPLRQLRRAMKCEAADPQVDALRTQLKQVELVAEKLELSRLEALSLGWPESATALSAGNNLRIYLSALELPSLIIEQAASQFHLFND